jgi:uncharacterized radical SAM superfamily Fe-S cluster-containing enzyme
MENKKEKPINYEQTPEQIREVLVEAKLKNLPVDLVILSLAGEPTDTPDLIIDSIEGDMLYMTYIADDGEVGELIPLEFSRIKKAEIRK